MLCCDCMTSSPAWLSFRLVVPVPWRHVSVVACPRWLARTTWCAGCTSQTSNLRSTKTSSSLKTSKMWEWGAYRSALSNAPLSAYRSALTNGALSAYRSALSNAPLSAYRSALNNGPLVYATLWVQFVGRELISKEYNLDFLKTHHLCNYICCKLPKLN